MKGRNLQQQGFDDMVYGENSHKGERMNGPLRLGYEQALALGLAVVMAGCATIVKGRTQSVLFNSTPSGARIWVNGEDRGATPANLELKKNKDYKVVIKKDGYQDVTINVDKEFTMGWSIVGNVFSWGILGVIVDVADGAAYKLTPEQTTIALEAARMSFTPNKNNDTFQLAVFVKERARK